MSSTREIDTPTGMELEASLVRALALVIDLSGPDVDLEAIKDSARIALRAEPESRWGAAARACATVGFRLKPSRCSPRELVDELYRGPALVLLSDGWGVLFSEDSVGSVPQLVEANGRQTALSLPELAARLGLASPKDMLTVGLFQPLSTHRSNQKLSPNQRLWSFFRPESSDIRVLLVFAVVVGVLSLATPIAVESIVNSIAFVGLLQPIIVLSLVLAVCLGLAAFVRSLEVIITEMIQRRLFVRLALDLAWRLPRVRRDAYDRHYGPELVNRFFDVTTIQKAGSKLLLDGVTAILSATIGLVVLAFYHPLLLAFDVVLVLLVGVITFAVGRGGVRTAVAESASKYSVADWLEELTRHPLAFRASGGREIAVDHADTLVNQYLNRRKIHFQVVFRQLTSALALQALSSTLLLGLGGWLVKEQQLSLGELVASWLIVSLVLASIAKLGTQLEIFYDLAAAADKVGKLLDLELEDPGGETLPRLTKPARLETNSLDFRWPDGSKLITGLELNLTPGNSLAVLGAAGSGKSTLLELLHGQRQPSSGQVRIEDFDLHSLRVEDVRRAVALAAPGETIAGTIANNVRMRDQSLTLSEVRDALESVGLWRPVQNLPRGVETELTSQGQPLSASQRALLVLARTMASKPSLLLVDGILDGLEPQHADLVLRALTDKNSPWTLVLATQSPQLAQQCDQTLELRSEAPLRSDREATS